MTTKELTRKVHFFYEPFQSKDRIAQYLTGKKKLKVKLFTWGWGVPGWIVWAEYVTSRSIHERVRGGWCILR